ncbi:transposase [Corynebacterium sp. 3HC-13]|uniref:transposase n=1 Tax=Corynebacterium poyangense TaxID=2684405 RepID=UPI001CCF2A72|nr:transposase [Corynebacterium poyangense]MBZ8176212.1 transposase [Corynebacterium poyangense]
MKKETYRETIKQGAITDFLESWKEFTSPSAAAEAVAQRWNISQATLILWLKKAQKWPAVSFDRLLDLEAENRQLREQVRKLRGI